MTPLAQNIQAPVEALHSRAEQNLEYIRQTMQRAETFTSVPGIGGVGMGVVGGIAAFAAARVDTPLEMLAVWIVAAPIAALLGGAFMFAKARRREAPLPGIVVRRFATGLAPPLFVGAVLTWWLLDHGVADIVPATWLMLYGAGAISGGAFSVRPVTSMGICFVVLGLVSAITPADWANVWLGVGFGGLHIVFGSIIAKYHGG